MLWDVRLLLELRIAVHVDRLLVRVCGDTLDDSLVVVVMVVNFCRLVPCGVTFFRLIVVEWSQEKWATAAVALDEAEDGLEDAESAEQLSLTLVSRGVVEFFVALKGRWGDVGAAKSAQGAKGSADQQRAARCVATEATAQIAIGSDEAGVEPEGSKDHKDEIDALQNHDHGI